MNVIVFDEGERTLKYRKKYHSPIGDINLGSDGTYLTALCFEESAPYNSYISNGVLKDLPIFEETIRWLNLYFQGINPKWTPKYKVGELSSFQRDVFDELLKIPYGQVITYGEIASKVARKRGLERMSAQAVGGAVSSNPIGIIIPCHRVVGANGNLTGYSGGMKNKIALLKLEGNDMKQYFFLKKGTYNGKEKM